MYRSDEDQPQHLRALAQANVIRLERAHLKRQLSNREVSLAELLEHESMASMALGDLLKCLPGQRRVAIPGREYAELRQRGTANKVYLAGRILDRAELNYNRRVGRLTKRQREAVLAWAEVLTPGGCP